jgi:spermidine/putrescine transport system ATP-binding protein
LVDETHLKMLGTTYECEAQSIYQGEDVKVIVEVDFDKLELLDDFEKAEVIGDVRFILYKGDHYHLTVMTEGRVNVYVDTNYVWDERDLVGIKILPKDMRIKFAAE